jgi:TetR/AcrR family fatty acid metabolism transcriptional regulator
MTKLTNRAKQAIETKNRIYECGVTLIRKQGFDQVTVDQISKEAGVSVGTYYYYFNSKFDLFSEIYHKGDEYFLTNVAGNLKSSDSIGKVLEFFNSYAVFNQINGIDLVKKLYTSDNKMFITKGRSMQTILQEIIKDGQSNGEIPTKKTSEEITQTLFLVARGVIYEWCLYDGTTDLNSSMNELISLVLEGIKNNTNN